MQPIPDVGCTASHQRREQAQQGECLQIPQAATTKIKKILMEKIILSKLDAIERNTLLASKNVLTIDDVALLTGMSKSHIYKLTCSKQIPFYRPNGKLVYFDRQELENWLKQNRVITIAEAEQKAVAYTISHPKSSQIKK